MSQRIEKALTGLGMEKKPRKHGPDNSPEAPDKAERFVSGLNERLVEDADKALKNQIYEALAPVRRLVDACLSNLAVPFDPKRDLNAKGEMYVSTFLHSLSGVLFDSYCDWNRRQALEKFMKEQEEFRQWIDARKQEMAAQEGKGDE
jgi:hypothetical protein